MFPFTTPKIGVKCICIDSNNSLSTHIYLLVFGLQYKIWEILEMVYARAKLESEGDTKYENEIAGMYVS